MVKTSAGTTVAEEDAFQRTALSPIAAAGQAISPI